MPAPLTCQHTGRALRVLVVRPADQQDSARLEVSALGGHGLLCPALHRAPPADPAAVRQALARALPGSLVVLTSAAAVRSLVELIPEHAVLHALLSPLRLAVVGPATATALSAIGLLPHITPAAGEGAAALAAAIETAARPTQTPPSVLFLRAQEALDTLPALLRRAGYPVQEVETYRMLPAPPTQLAPIQDWLVAQQVDLLPFTSPRTAQIVLAFLGQAAPALLSGVIVGAIGQTTQLALAAWGLPHVVCPTTSTFEALLVALADAHNRHATPCASR